MTEAHPEASYIDGEPETHHIRVVLAPMGTRCGLAAFRSKGSGSGGAWSIRVLVLPRAWDQRCSTTGWRIAQYDSGEEVLTIIGHECRSMVLPAKGPWLTRLARVASEVAAADKKRDLVKCARDGDARPDVESELPNQVRGLFSLELVSAQTECTPSLEQPDQTVANSFDHLLRLVLLARLPLEDRDVRASSISSGYTVRSGHIRSAPMRALLAQAFVSMVDRNQREIRHGYVVREEDLRSPRGRPTTRGLVRHLATRTPRLICEHDEFTPGTPLFRVLVSTLDHIATGGVSQDDLGPTVQGIVDRAVNLRQQLAHIPSYPLMQATQTAHRLRLNLLNRGWLPALDMARLLLQNDDLQPSSTVDGGGGFVWLVETPSLWEHILEQALEAGGKNVSAQEALKSPWTTGGKQLPDLVCRFGCEAWLLDAKYKPKMDNRPSASWSDMRQLYVYSLLPPTSSMLPSPPTTIRAALIYPRMSRSQRRAKLLTEWSTREPLWLPMASQVPGALEKAIQGDDVKMGCLLADFPQPAGALTNDQAWKEYIRTLGMRLIQLIEAAGRG